jgi:hypothetical protein
MALPRGDNPYRPREMHAGVTGFASACAVGAPHLERDAFRLEQTRRVPLPSSSDLIGGPFAAASSARRFSSGARSSDPAPGPAARTFGACRKMPVAGAGLRFKPTSASAAGSVNLHRNIIDKRVRNPVRRRSDRIGRKQA